MIALRFILAPLVVLFHIGTVMAAEVDVAMLNKSSTTKESMVFEPSVVRINVGDTVNWLATDRGHNVEFIKGAVPEGVERFKSPLNKAVSFTFETPGVYMYKCTPHYGMGMIGVVVVGDDFSNLDTVKDVRYPGRAKKRAAKLFEELS